MSKQNYRWYCGKVGNLYEAFRSRVTPTQRTHGDMYTTVIGPFKTKRAAKWTERFGYRNPHFRHVDDAERLAAEETRR